MPTPISSLADTEPRAETLTGATDPGYSEQHIRFMFNDIKQLGKETAIYGVSTIIGRFLNFLLVPLYTNVFSRQDYGLVTNVYAYIALLNIIYLYGMDSAYLKYASTEELGDERKTFSTAYNAVLLSSLLYSMLFLVFRSGLFRQFALAEGQTRILFFIMGILFFDAVSIVPFARLRFHNRPWKFALIKSVNIVVNLALNVVFILRYHMGIEGVFLAGLAASVLTWLILLPDILRNLEFRVSRGQLGPLLRFGIPFVPTGLASMITQVIDRPILLALTNAATVGVYQANYKLGIFMMLFVSMFQYAWQPFFLKNAARQDAKILFGKVLTAFLLAASAIFIVLSLFIENIVKLSIFGKHLIGRDFWGGLPIVPIILLAYLFNGLYINFMAGIQIEKKTQFLPIVTGAGALANVAANFLLIPKYGYFGAAWATLVSYLIMAAGNYFFSQRFYRVQYEYGKLALVGTALLVSFGGYLMAKRLWPDGGILLKMIALIIYLVLIFSFRLVDLRTIKKI
ncbi:MAG TPA: polysaccharide biosynthesis C-terminal domain-containing protein [Candidatus Desulfaltia sp.]|nr:polysaccharide biosynthesis C-terminal domain-containing protein [Candidatus Desulfaltia sp.]